MKTTTRQMLENAYHEEKDVDVSARILLALRMLHDKMRPAQDRSSQGLSEGEQEDAPYQVDSHCVARV